MLKKQFTPHVINETRVLQQTPGDSALLKNLVDRMFPGSFPRGEAAEAVSLAETLGRGGVTEEGNIYRTVICGTSLDDPSRAVVKGLCIGLLFPRSETAATWYLVTDSAQRRQGVGRMLVEDTAEALREILPSRELKGYFAHIHDPALPESRAGDPFDSVVRVDFYDSLDAQKVPLPSRFPSPVEDGESMPYMLVAIPQRTGAPPSVTKEAVIAHAEDYFREYGFDPVTHPDFARLARETEALPANGVLAPLKKAAPARARTPGAPQQG